MNQKILIFEPHPDDVAFQISGSVVRWLDEGDEVMICTVTDGGNSTFDIDMTSSQIGKVMADEHARAMAILGLDVAHVIKLGYADLGLDPGRDRLPLLRDMIRLIRLFKPSSVVSMDPKNCENEENPDHKLVAVTGLEASAMAAYPNVFREQFEEHSVTRHFVGRMLYYMSPDPDLFVDISGEPLKKKIELGLAYDSQLELMITEAKERLKTLARDLPLFEIPREQLWPMMCEIIASDTADMHNRIHPELLPLKHAEGFRLQYLGVVDKIKSMLE